MKLSIGKSTLTDSLVAAAGIIAVETVCYSFISFILWLNIFSNYIFYVFLLSLILES